jgi:hypothetical protein
MAAVSVAATESNLCSMPSSLAPGYNRVSCTRPKPIPYHGTSAPSRDRSQPSQKAVLKCAHDEVIFSLRTKPGFQFFEPRRFGGLPPTG